MSETRGFEPTLYDKTASKIIEILASLKLSDSESINAREAIKHNLINCLSTDKTTQAQFLATNLSILISISPDHKQSPIITAAINEINALLISNPLNLNNKELIGLYNLSMKNDNEYLKKITLDLIVRQLLNPESFTEMDKTIRNIDNPSRVNMENRLLGEFSAYHAQLSHSAQNQHDHLSNKLINRDHSLIFQQTAALDRELQALALPENFNYVKAHYNDYRERLLAAHDSLMQPREEQKGKTDLQIIKSSRHPTWRAFVKILENLFSYFEKKKESLEQRGHHKFWKPPGYDHAKKAKKMQKELGIKHHGKGHGK